MAIKQKIEGGSVYQFNPFASTWKKIGQAPEKFLGKKFEGKVFEGKDVPINSTTERKVAGKVYLPEMSTIADSVGSAVGGAIMRGGKSVSEAILNAGKKATTPAFQAGEQAASNVSTTSDAEQPSAYGEITAPKGGANYYARALMSNAYKAGENLVNAALPTTPKPVTAQAMPPSDQGMSVQDMKNRNQAQSDANSQSLYEGRLAIDKNNYLRSKFQQEQMDLEALHQKNVASELEYNRQKNAFPWESKSSGIVVEKQQPPMSTKDFTNLPLDKKIERAGIPLTPEQNAAAEALGRAKIEAEFPSAPVAKPSQGNMVSNATNIPKYDYTEYYKRQAMAKSGSTAGSITDEASDILVN